MPRSMTEISFLGKRQFYTIGDANKSNVLIDSYLNECHATQHECGVALDFD